MNQRGSRQQKPKSSIPIDALDPGAAYHATMILIRNRFLAIASSVDDEQPLTRAERIGLQVRKIVEGVAYGCLSGVEYRNQQTLADQRTKDADKLLVWLISKNLLKLPCAQRIEPSPSPEYEAVLAGAGEFDLNAGYLRSAYSRASALVHERHPERLSTSTVVAELAAIEADAERLRSWLWLHIMFLRGEGFLVQMGQFGTPSFMVPLTREADLPSNIE